MGCSPALLVLGTVGLSLAACASGGGPAARSTTTPSTTTLRRATPSGATTGALTVGGMPRTYRLYVPGSVDRGHPAPLVVVLHGGFGVGAGAVQQGHWDATAEARGFVTVAPDGIGKTWNAGICCGQAAKRQLDDVGFVVALVDEIARRRPIDRTRVYATGISNGGLLAYRLGCEASDDFAAVGPVAATLPVTCDPSQPVSVIHVHGLADRNVPFTGGVGSKGVTRTNWPAVEPGIDRWVAIDGCDPRTATSTTQGRVTTATWPACRAGTAVELVTISDGGHSWPGGQRMSPILDPPSDALDGTDTIWAFFAAHPKR